MLVKFWRDRRDAAGQEIVKTVEMEVLPRRDDWVAVDPDDAAEQVREIAFVLADPPFVNVVLR